MGLIERISFAESAENAATQAIWAFDPIVPLIPRGSIGRIISTRIAAQGRSALLTSESSQMAIIKLPNIPVIFNERELIDKKPLWVGYMGTEFEAGSTDTANVVVQNPSINELVSFKGHRSSQIRNVGTRSNEEAGWTIASRGRSGNLNIDYFVSGEMEIEYIETSRSKRATWSMEQITEEETQ